VVQLLVVVKHLSVAVALVVVVGQALVVVVVVALVVVAVGLLEQELLALQASLQLV
tara:strand:- start:513 stop:680 length:168 start_codon:yes stop_codon:yes gene_type:complete